MTVSLLDHHSLKRDAASTAAAVVAVSAVVNLAMLAAAGVRTGGDSVRYVDGAANLLAGRPLAGMQALFPGYIALVAASQLAGAGRYGVVLVQIAVAAAATLVLFRIGARLSTVAGGAIAALLFAINVDIARWHIYLLTDSLYISLVVIATYAIHVAVEDGGWRYALAIAAVLAAATLRPHGRVLVLAAAGYWLVRSPARGRSAAPAYLSVVVLVAGVVLTAGSTLRAEAETPSRWLADGVVVWSDDGSRIAMPTDRAIDLAAAGPTSLAPLRYAARHPVATLRLAAARVGIELLHARRFYSTPHNVAVIGWLAATYALALAGFVRCRRDPLARLIALVVGLHLLFVAATFADWDGRFLLYALPLINVFAAVELAARVRRAPAPTLA